MGDQATGLSVTIYLMLAAVFGLAGSLVWFIVRTVKRGEAARDAVS